MLKNFIQKRNFFSIIKQHQTGLKTTFGKYDNIIRTPGIYMRLPFIQQMLICDMREQLSFINKQNLISLDNVSFNVNGVIQWKIVESHKACFNVNNVYTSIINKSSIILKNCLSGMEINDILSQREKLNNIMLEHLKNTEKNCGIKIININIKDIEFDETMRRAMSVKAEADRNAMAKIINAESDIKTAKIYNETAKLYAENPITLRLREYQLWQSVSKNPANTIYVVPTSLLNSISNNSNSQKLEK